MRVQRTVYTVARYSVLLAVLALALPADARAPLRHGFATSYCLIGRMANGHRTHVGAAASVTLPLGTRIRLEGRLFYGRRRFTITDTGHLAARQLDLWHPSCAAAIRWGRRPVAFRVLARG